MYDDVSKSYNSDDDSSTQATVNKVPARRKYTIKFEDQKIQVLADQLYERLYAKHDAGLVCSNNQKGISECVMFDTWKVQIINGKKIKYFTRFKDGEDFQEVTFAKWGAPEQFKFVDCSEKKSGLIKRLILSNLIGSQVDGALRSKCMLKNADGYWVAVDEYQHGYGGTRNSFGSLLQVRNRKNAKFDHSIYKQFVSWIYKETQTSKEFLSAIFSMKGYTGGGYQSRLDLKEFMKYVRSRDGLMKVSVEHRNLLPLLGIVPIKHWGNDNLFSTSGASPVAFSLPLIKFCVKQPYGVVSYLASKKIIFEQNSLLGEVIKKIYIPVEMTKQNRQLLVRALLNIVEERWNFQRLDEPRQKEILTLIGNMLVRPCLESYFRVSKNWMRFNEITDVFDWLFRREVIDEYPRKNDTWQSLKRKSDAWHRELYAENERQNAEWQVNEQQWLVNEQQCKNLMDHPKPLLKFPPLQFKNLEIDGVYAKPISDSYQLMDHASLMQHCVNSYSRRCFSGHYQVVELSCGDEVVTAGYSYGRNGKFRLDQVRGFRNKKPSPLLEDVARKLLPTINIKKTRSAKTAN